MSSPTRRGKVLLIAAGICAVALLLAAAMQGTLTYARTPAELQQSSSVGERLRVEGVVVPDSLVEDSGTTSFLLEGEGRRIRVSAHTAPAGAFREGQGAVVEGFLSADGSVVADRVIAQHGNVYRPAVDG